MALTHRQRDQIQSNHFEIEENLKNQLRRVKASLATADDQLEKSKRREKRLQAELEQAQTEIRRLRGAIATTVAAPEIVPARWSRS